MGTVLEEASGCSSESGIMVLEQKPARKQGAPNRCCHRTNPDRIRILFDDHRLVANAGLLLPATLARHLGLRELVDHHLDLGGAPGRANTGDKMLTLVASALAGGDCIDDARCAARWWDGRCSRLRGQGAIHPGDLPAQLPVGACPSTRPREPPVVGPGLGPWGRTRRLAPDHRPGLDHLRDLWTGQGGSAPPRLYRRPRLSPAAGHCRRHRRRADGPAARGPAPTPPVAPPTSCVRRWGGCATAGPRDNSRCGPTAASTPTLSLPPAGKWMSASLSPSASAPACGT